GIRDSRSIRVAKQKVRKRISAEHSVETILAEIVAREERNVVAIAQAAVVGAEFERVPALDPTQIVVDLNGPAELGKPARGAGADEASDADIRNAGDLRRIGPQALNAESLH